MKNNLLILALVAAAMPAFAGSSAKAPVAPAPAPEVASFSYDNVNLLYTAGFVESSAEVDALSSEVNVSITDWLYFSGAVGISGDDSIDDVFTARASGGVHFPIVAGALDFFAEAGIGFYDVEGGDDQTVFVGSAGFRAFLGPVDTELAFTYADVDFGAVWNGNLTFWVPVVGGLDVGAGAGLNLEDTDLWSLSGGIRYRF